MSEAKKWKARLSAAHDQHDKHEKDYQRNKKYYRGQQWDGADANDFKDLVVDNIVATNIWTIISSIFSQNPIPIVVAQTLPYKKPDGKFYNPLAAERQWLMLLKHYYKKVEFAWKVRRCMFDAELANWGIVEIGYFVETEIVENRTGDDILHEELIKGEGLFVERVSPTDFRVDPECTDHRLNTAKWVARSWTRPLEEVKEDIRYSNTEDLKANFTVKTSDTESGLLAKIESVREGSKKGNDDLARVKGWDIWDRKSHEIITIVETHNKILSERPWPIEFKGFPFEILYYNENPDEIYPLSPTTMDIPVQDEINRIGSLQLSHVRKAAGLKIVVDENKFDDPQAKRQFTDGPIDAVIGVNGDVDKAMAPIRTPNVSQDIYIMRSQLKAANNEARGIGDFESGRGSSVGSSGEAQLVAQGIGVRRSDRRSSVDDFMSRVTAKMGQTLQQTLVDPVLIRLNDAQFADATTPSTQGVPNVVASKLSKIVGVDGEQVLLPWMTIRKEDLLGDFDFDIKTGSGRPYDENAEKNDAAFLYQQTIQDPYIRHSELAKDLLQAYHKDTAILLKTEEQVAQEQQQAQQAQQQQIDAQMQAELQDRQIKSQTDLQKTEMKINSAELQAALKLVQKAESDEEKNTVTLTSELIKAESAQTDQVGEKKDV